MNPENPATCVSVEITKQISETSWNAKAKLDNGTVIPIVIKLHDNDMLEIDYSAWLINNIEKEITKEIDKAAKEFAKEMDKLLNDL
jgi:hypothetical protein